MFLNESTIVTHYLGKAIFSFFFPLHHYQYSPNYVCHSQRQIFSNNVYFSDNCVVRKKDVRQAVRASWLDQARVAANVHFVLSYYSVLLKFDIRF